MLNAASGDTRIPFDDDETGARAAGGGDAPGSVPADLAPELLWQQLLGALLEKFGPARAERWFGGLSAPTCDEDGRLVLSAASPFIAEWIEDNYRAEVESLGRERFAIPGIRIVVRAPRLSGRRRGGGPAAQTGEEAAAKTAAGDARVEPTAAEGRSAIAAGGDARRARRSAPPSGLPESLRDISPNLTLERFVVGSCNRVAFHAAREALQRPGGQYNPLFVYGGCGLGKTHLLQGITRASFKQGERRIRYLPAEGFVNRFGVAVRRREIARFRERFRTLKVLVLDDVQIMSGKERTQLELLETIDTISANGGQVFLASDCRPAELDRLAEKLLGRFISGLVCRVSEPEIDTRYAILRQEAKASGVKVDPETLRTIAERSLGNVRDLIGTWVRVLAHASLLQEPITIARVEEILSEQARPGRSADGGRLTIDRIVEEVGRRYGVPPIEFRGRSRSRTVSLARHIAIYIARVLTDHSLGEIGEALGGRRHATTSAAYRKIQKELLRDEQLRIEIERLIHGLRG